MDLTRLRQAIRHTARLPEAVSCLQHVEQGASVVAHYVGLRPLQFPCTVRFRNGLQHRLEEPYDVETLWQIHFHRVYPLDSTDRVIVDAGANVGLFACWAALSNPNATIWAIEPSPASVRRLHEHLDRNGVRDRVSVLPVALASRRSSVWLAESAMASQMDHVSTTAVGTATEVDAIRLQDVVAEIPHEAIDFLKMDIEGSEYDVVLSATPADLARIRRISLEYHAAPRQSGHDKRVLIEHLKGCGFARIVDTTPSGTYGILHARR